MSKICSLLLKIFKYLVNYLLLYFIVQWAFWLTTGGIVAGAVIAFFIMYSYLKSKKIL